MASRVRAVFVRGGSSKGVFFHAGDLPAERAARDALFLEVLGSPDPYQRQLNGMGGGISSLSKAVIVEPSPRADADVDYTFAQVAVDSPVVDYGATCGNLSSAVGPFAVDEGLIDVADGEARVRVHMTNTGKVYHARFDVHDGKAVEAGDFEIPGVTGPGAKIVLDYLDPGGAATSGLLPSGSERESVTVDGVGAVEVSLVDATTPVVFVAADALGVSATETPEALDADGGIMRALDRIRREGGVRMGLAGAPAEVGLASPKVAVVAERRDFVAIDGTAYAADEADVTVRMVSMERIHRACPLTGALCVAAASRIEGTIVHQLARARAPLRIANPSGVLPVDADVVRDDAGRWQARSVTAYRTQRRLMEGWVLAPETAPA